jgi:uncharacterized protein YecE (DUF72 family)
MPMIVAVTSPELAYMRLHGRNAESWTKGRTVAERFDYAYAEDELRELVEPAIDMAERAKEVAVVFNNNARDYALRNAREYEKMLVAARAALEREAAPGS